MTDLKTMQADKRTQAGEARGGARRIDDIVLRARDISHGYDGEEILTEVSLELRRGELVTVLGLSGSGKTTLFNILAGLTVPDRGTVSAESKIGYLMQKDLLLPWKRLIDNISLPLRLSGVPRREARERAAKFLPRFGLRGLERRWPSQLSGGQRQRAAILRTRMYGGEIMLLDEPFAGLDALTREEIYLWLTDLRREDNLTILLITHDIEEALSLSDRVLVLAAGHPTTLHPALEIQAPVSSRDMAEKRQALRRMLFTDREGRLFAAYRRDR